MRKQWRIVNFANRDGEPKFAIQTWNWWWPMWVYQTMSMGERLHIEMFDTLEEANLSMKRRSARRPKGIPV